MCFSCWFLQARAGQSCASMCHSISIVTPTRTIQEEKGSISTNRSYISNKCKMVNKYVILPEIDLPLRNSLLTNTSKGSKVLRGIRYPNHVRIQNVPRSLSWKRALQNFPLRQRPPTNDLRHANSRASSIKEETHSFPHMVNRRSGPGRNPQFPP